MPNLLYVLILLAIVVALVILRKPKSPKKPFSYPYQSKEFLISPSERSFFGVLDQVLTKSNYRVFVQVRLADIVQVDKGLRRAAWQSAFNTISRKHVDFVICKIDDMAIVGAIELDDESHKQGKRIDRDVVVDKILEAAGIPLVRIRAASTYTPNDIKTLLSTQMDIKLADDFSAQGLQSIDPEKSTDSNSEENVDSPHPNRVEEPTCPKCGSILLPRVAKKGKYQGQKFWGCPQFPKCKYVAKRA